MELVDQEMTALALQRAAEQAGASDPEWQRQLDDIRQQLDRALTPELRQKLEQLERALRDLDAERTRERLAERILQEPDGERILDEFQAAAD